MEKINSNNFFIFGKGSSLNYLNNLNFKNCITIGLNFSSFKNYIFDYTIDNKKRKIITRNKNEIDFSLIEKKDDFIIGKKSFLISLSLNFIVQKFTDINNIFLIGCDFNFNSIEDDFKIDNRNYNFHQKSTDINSQIFGFLNLKEKFKYLNIYRLGFDKYSDFDVRYFNNDKIVLEKTNYKTEIVSEITTNHHGDINKLKKMILLSKASGADTVKLQKRDVNNFYSKEELDKNYKSPFGKTFRDYRLKLELSLKEIEEIIDYSKKININLFFSTLDLTSYNQIRELGIKRVKIPSTISNNINFINKVLIDHKDELVISTGMTDQKYIDYILSKKNKKQKLYLLHCISSYPTYYKDSNLNIIKYYCSLRKYNIVAGYSSHDIGSFGSCLAIASGAKMVEKHVKIGSKSWAHFDDTALDLNYEFKGYINELRKTESYLGSDKKMIYKSETHKYKV